MKHKFLCKGKQRDILVTKLLCRDCSFCKLCFEKLDRKIKDIDSMNYITIDHIVYISAAGLNHIDNLQLTHKRCNYAKGTLYQEEYFKLIIEK